MLSQNYKFVILNLYFAETYLEPLTDSDVHTLIFIARAVSHLPSSQLHTNAAFMVSAFPSVCSSLVSLDDNLT